MKIFEIYFNDLTDSAQEEYLDLCGVDDESELNHEIVPLAILEMEEEDL